MLSQTVQHGGGLHVLSRTPALAPLHSTAPANIYKRRGVACLEYVDAYCAFKHLLRVECVVNNLVILKVKKVVEFFVGF